MKVRLKHYAGRNVEIAEQWCYTRLPLFQGFVQVLESKILEQIKDHQTFEAEKWMADLAIRSIHLKEGNTFSR